ncbi:CHAP domain-containing protein [Streptococcus thermophilus]|nr:CHAP domain-containing protein [Streptococcus thermophilus]MCE2173125.1 CHAP domain-containing protein [Streptococcus thermophilus]MCE2176405.1 CHAP domain-containing protein [Streptococcus thermophilus]MCE2178091.1 CHAP domain-containing protein [Streptococcus thermophilus]MCE2179738.1 CHAP domain-containing protein [Streptococcus thermophilus]
MLSKSKTTKALLYSTAALSLFAASHVHADETSHWTARSVDQIKADISVNDNQQTYTVKYGDTLSSIAEAMKIDVNVLANINEITNIDMIFPGTVLTTTYNAKHQAVSVKVETPASETSNTPVVAESNLTTNKVTVNGQSVAADLSTPVDTVRSTAAQTPAKEESTQVVSDVTKTIVSASDTPAYADTEQSVADAIDHVTSATTETSETSEQAETSAQAEATETTETTAQAETSAQAETTETTETTEEASETSEAPAEEAQAEAPAEATEEAPAEQLVSTSEDVSETSEAPAEEAPVEEVLAEEVLSEEVPVEEAPVEEAPVEEAPVEEAPAELAATYEYASTPNTYPVGQCTWGAKTMAPWVGNYWGNAKDWIASAQAAGHSVGTTPVAGAIAVWPNEGGGYGHVAYVTSVSDEHAIQVMESNYAGNMLIGNYRGTFDPTSSAHGGSVYYIYP